MKLLKRKFRVPLRLTITLFGVVMGLNFVVTSTVNATPAFARNTGAECVKCHTASFPRLNWMGERYMRNGFALPSKGELVLGAFQDKKKAPSRNKELKNLTLKDVNEIFSVRGAFIAYDKTEDDPATSVGSPSKFYIFASGQIAENVPLWAEGEISSDSGEFEVHNYFIGRTNISDSTLLNVRMGGFTPTEWTSVSDQKRSLDSASSHPGAYRGKSGFTQVAEGLGGKTGIEYYGYTDAFFWAVGYGDGKNFDKSAPAESKDKNTWVVARLDFLKGSSVSILYFNAGDVNDNGTDLTAYVVSANYRAGNKLDIRAQYSQDDSGGNGNTRNDVSGYSLQADWQLSTHWVGIARYDTTDNGLSTRAEETQATVAAVWVPYQNIKMTAAYTAELDRAQFANDDPADRGTKEADLIRLQLQFAF